MDARVDYYAAGGNCHPSAADWNADIDAFAYGASSNLGIWTSSDRGSPRICQLLTGHRANINAVKFTHVNSSVWIVTGSADGHIGLWRPSATLDGSLEFELERQVTIHESSVECIGSTKGLADSFLSGSADGSIKFWKIDAVHDNFRCTLIQSILTTEMIPLSISLYSIVDDGVICTVSGTKSTIDVYTLDEKGLFTKQQSLSGHSGWVRALDLFQYPGGPTQLTGSILLASAGQDRLVRIWKISPGDHTCTKFRPEQTDERPSEPSLDLSRKTYVVGLHTKTYNVTFEALLAGHEDWVFSIRWKIANEQLQLLSASADNTITVWNLSHTNDVWVASSRVGDLSVQKGATSATGSMGGFWNCLWSPDGGQFVGLTKTGGWRRWRLSDSGVCREEPGLCGHTGSVTDLDWAQSGAYLLSVSSDQTTRLHSEWIEDDHCTWHEMSRPQIHGYDVNCVGALGDTVFVSGSDEKLLRVFDLPDEIAESLARLRRQSFPSRRRIHTAGVPILGLSNKSDQLAQELIDGQVHRDAVSTGFGLSSDVRKYCPPSEDHLSKRTLWPEKEKLYGHGLEICALAVSFDGLQIATSCKASSLDHAMIRIFSTVDWREILPPLKAHTLTVTSLQFSHDSRMLLSVGRDRQIVVWRRSDEVQDRNFMLYAFYTKAHLRMIFSVTWLQSNANGGTFVTSSRDKFIKVWTVADTAIKLHDEITTSAAVTAMHSTSLSSITSNGVLLAAGMETGEIHIYRLAVEPFQLLSVSRVQSSLSPSFTINRAVWRPRRAGMESENCELPLRQLAIASEDQSLRIFTIQF